MNTNDHASRLPASTTGNGRFVAPEDDAIAIHVMKLLTSSHRAKQVVTLQDLSDALELRRTDVRRVVSALHREGFLDVIRMRPTLAGFAIGKALEGRPLKQLRREPSVVWLHRAA